MRQGPQHDRLRHPFAHDDRPDPENRQAPFNIEDGEIPRWVLVAIVLIVIALGIAGVMLLN